MELKHKKYDPIIGEYKLLIVPYGIETPFFLYGDSRTSLLLIVPYGIET